MTAAGLVFTLALSPGLTIAADGHVFETIPARDVRSIADHHFQMGTKFRDNRDTARKWFHEAARGYDDLWRRGLHNPALALNRSRAHRLAGDLPGAIAALHAGLAAARHDRTLQVELDDLRAAVSYPLDGELAGQCRPRPVLTIGARMSPAEAYLAAGLLWLAACLGVARFAMTRTPWGLAFSAAALVGLGALGGLWWHDWRYTRQETRPLVVVADEALLRRGNGASYPPRLEPRLPQGVEARELTRRGGWVQVELAGGAVGWLPEAAVR
jgi:hypothetical protein